MSQNRLGDRTEYLGRIQTLGFVAESSDGDLLAVLRVAPGELTDADERYLSPDELLIAAPLQAPAATAIDERMVIGDLVDLEAILDVSVHRFHPIFGRVQGVVTALCGAVRVKFGNTTVVVDGLVEIRFDAEDHDRAVRTPRLEVGDVGSLVTTWSGEVLGLIVAGGGHIAYVAPLHGFLAKNQLDYTRLRPSAGVASADLGQRMVEAEAGIAASAAELGREPSLDFDEMPEAA